MQARVVRAINLAHASLADQREDFVGSEFIAGRKRHSAMLFSLTDRCKKKQIPRLRSG
jgi:hypothetical protein